MSKKYNDNIFDRVLNLEGILLKYLFQKEKELENLIIEVMFLVKKILKDEAI